MDNKQKVMLVAVVLCVLTGLFPPWNYILTIMQSPKVRSARYAFIGSPPTPTDFRLSVELDLSRLILQWAVIAVAAYGVSKVIRN